MRLLLVADLRSPTAKSWATLVARRHDVFVISSQHLSADDAPNLAHAVVPLGFSPVGANGASTERAQLSKRLRKLASSSRAAGFANGARLFAAPLDLKRRAPEIRRIVRRFEPDVIHALRIPFEGMGAAVALERDRGHPPLALSTWGNDLTLQALRNPWVGRATRQALSMADGLHCDCRRDQRLAARWGWRAEGPELVVPGSGGVDVARFTPGESKFRTARGWTDRTPVVLNARGLRTYVRTDIYARALPLVLNAVPHAWFVSIGTAHFPGFLELPAAVQERIIHLHPQSPDEMADVYRAATVTVSPSLHDGTPNTLLEAMASGCLPIVHPVESVLEWVMDGRTGVVVDATDVAALAQAIIRGICDARLRRTAAPLNRAAVLARADRTVCVDLIDRFYDALGAHRH